MRTVNEEARRAKKIERMETASSTMRKTDLPLLGKSRCGRFRLLADSGVKRKP